MYHKSRRDHPDSSRVDCACPWAKDLLHGINWLSIIVVNGILGWEGKREHHGDVNALIASISFKLAGYYLILPTSRLQQHCLSYLGWIVWALTCAYMYMCNIIIATVVYITLTSHNQHYDEQQLVSCGNCCPLPGLWHVACMCGQCYQCGTNDFHQE